VLAARRRTGITWEGQPIDRLMRLFHSPRPLSATNLTRRSVALNGFVDSRDEGEGGEEADHAEHGEGSEAHQPHIPKEEACLHEAEHGTPVEVVEGGVPKHEETGRSSREE